MTSTLTPRIQSLRAQIFSLLGSQLGTYQFTRNGGTVPALGVIPDAQYGYGFPPGDAKVTNSGLEVIIRAVVMNGTPLIGGFLNRLDYYVYLRAHKPGTLLHDAVVTLQAAIPEIRELLDIPANEATNQPAAVRLTVSDYVPVFRN